MVNSNNNKNEHIKGHWNKIDIKIKKKIKSNYDKIKDWEMDPKGYFLIKVDKKNNWIRVGYCRINNTKNKKIHEMICEIKRKSAIEVVNTISSLRIKFSLSIDILLISILSSPEL